VGALDKVRWPNDFPWPRSQDHEHEMFYGRRLKRYKCWTCGHRVKLIVILATKLPMPALFLAFYLIGQAKIGISSLKLSRHLGINYDIAWLAAQ